MRSFLNQLKWHSGLHSLGLSMTLCALAGCGGGEEATVSAPETTAPADSGAATADTGEAAASGMAAGMHGGEAASMAAPPSAAAGGSMPGSMPGGMTQGPGPESSDSGSMAAMHGAGPPGGGEVALSGVPGGAGGPGMMPGGMMPGGMSGAMPGGEAAAKPPRPTDFARWSDKDFHDAVRERDETVLKAIDARVKAKPKDPDVATLLTALLITSAEAPAPGQSGPGSFPGGDSAAFSSGDSGSGPMMSGPGAMPPASGVRPGKSPSQMLGPPAGGTPSPPGAMAPEQNSQFKKSELPGIPSTSIQRHSSGRAIDSIELMLLESLVAYQQPGVMAGRGAAESLSGGDRRGGDDAAALGSSPMGAMGMPGMSGMQGAGGMQPGRQNGVLDTRVLVQRIIEHLVNNGTPVAWQTIFAVASGSTQTSLTSIEATQIVAESLLKNLESGGPQVEQVLLAIVEGKAQLPPENRSVILSTLAAVSSAAADKLTGFDKAFAVASPNQPGGMGMPGGFGGSMPGGRGDDDGSAMGFGPGSGMGAPGMTGPGFGGANQTPAAAVTLGEFKDAELTRAAAFIWGPKSVSAIVEQLKAAADPVAAGELLKLAATIPNQKTREAVFASLSKVHSLGADSLRGVGVFSDVHDPGLLVILKSLPRPKASRNDAQPMDSWTMTSEEMVLSLRDKLKALSSQPGKLTAVNDGFPVKLHRNAVADFSGVLTLPGNAGTNLKDAAPSETKVYYARTSFTPQKAKDQDDIKEHYEARASGTARPDQAKQLLWIDGVKGGTTGVRRSMDVIIQASGNGNGQGFGAAAGSGFGNPNAPGAPGGQGGAFTIEIIVVETADPKGGSTASADPVPAKSEKK